MGILRVAVELFVAVVEMSSQLSAATCSSRFLSCSTSTSCFTETEKEAKAHISSVLTMLKAKKV